MELVETASGVLLTVTYTRDQKKSLSVWKVFHEKKK